VQRIVRQSYRQAAGCGSLVVALQAMLKAKSKAEVVAAACA
jgi:hypothetical protein